MISIDLKLFHYALEAAEHGSFRRAADALNIQQSTVSRGVMNLEHRVGAKLFERGHAGVRPTLAGDQFLEEATLGFNHLRRALHRIGAMERGEDGEITVGVSVPFARMVALLEKFRAEFQGISVEIVESTSIAASVLTHQGNLDVAFVGNAPSHGAPQSLHLGDQRMVVVLPESHPLAHVRKLSLEDLRDERFILGEGGLGPEIEKHLVERMGRLGVDPRVQLHCASQLNLFNIVAMGFGVTIATEPLPHAAMEGVAVVPLAGRNIVPLHAIWMESNPNPALKGLLRIVRKHSRPGAGG